MVKRDGWLEPSQDSNEEESEDEESPEPNDSAEGSKKMPRDDQRTPMEDPTPETDFET